MSREVAARISYWAIFLVLPAAATFALLGVTMWSVLSLALLLLAADHGFRRWQRLFQRSGTTESLSGAGTGRRIKGP